MRKNLETKYREVIERRYEHSIFKDTKEWDDMVSKMSNEELCFRIIADDQDLTRQFAELYRGYLLGDNPSNPMESLIKQIDVI